MTSRLRCIVAGRGIGKSGYCDADRPATAATYTRPSQPGMVFVSEPTHPGYLRHLAGNGGDFGKWNLFALAFDRYSVTIAGIERRAVSGFDVSPIRAQTFSCLRPAITPSHPAATSATRHECGARALS